MKKYTDEFPWRYAAAKGKELLLQGMDGSPKGRYRAGKAAGFDIEMVLSESPTVVKGITLLPTQDIVSRQGAVLPRAFDIRTVPERESWTSLFIGQHTRINAYVFDVGSRLIRDHDADHVWFVYNGSGICYTDYGNFGYRAGDFIYVPRGTLTCLTARSGGTRMIGIESTQGFRKRARSVYDNIMVPYNEFVVSLPIPEYVEDSEELRTVLVRRGGQWSEITYAYTPFLCLAWQGTPYPFAIHSSKLNLPYVDSIHPDPSNFAVFVSPDGSAMISVLGSRRVHSLPYDHANPLTEVLFYAKEYDARKGSDGGVGESGTATVHPMGVWHGPQMAAFENWKKPASPKDLPYIDDLAIMFETADALFPTLDAKETLIPGYENSWLRSWEEYQSRHPKGMGGVGGW
ncbi:homogentisate 1,2-dioxygenase [Candidatus Kaiserbacteria bacterium]|nr:homogentisate 1,2-dioxygenase [Candidatus Kaiserbacteria bacterium]